MGKMKRVLINLTEKQLEELDKLVKEGFYGSRTEAVREAVRILLESKKLNEIQEKVE
jgi:Arc/MetJ-type ribon-helix-helix transcriptional regulator